MKVTKKRWGSISAAILFVTALFIGFGVVIPAAPANADVGATIPATGDFTLPGCVGTTSTPDGEINTPENIKMTGKAAADLRSGKAVFLYDAKGDKIVNANGNYNTYNVRLAFCGAMLAEGSSTEVIIDWRFCTDQRLGGCAGEPPSAVEGNEKLSEAQEAAIAMQLVDGDKSSKRARSLLQLQIWCISEYETSEKGVIVEPGNQNIYAKDYFNAHLFSNESSSPEAASITDAEATCAPWGVLPEDPELNVTMNNSPVDLGETLEFSVASNITGDVTLLATGNEPLTLCGPTQNVATLNGTVLLFASTGSVNICVTPTVAGDISLTAIKEDIPRVSSLGFVWNGEDDCQVFADYSFGQLDAVSGQAIGTVRNLIPGFTADKTAVPAHGESVVPGDTITYTLVGTNTGETVLDPVTLTDQLAGVLDHASYNNDVNAVTSAGSVGTSAFDEANSVLEWNGSLVPGETVTVSFSVTVDADSFGNTLENKLEPSATPPGWNPIIPYVPEVEHPIPSPGFTLVKDALPREGSVVNPGDSITYSVTASNTGDTVLNPVTVEDDLSGVLSFAEIDEDSLSATINGSPAAAPTLTGTTMRWEGALQSGDELVLSYTVMVNLDTVGVTIKNTAKGVAVPPGGGLIPSPPGDTEHFVPDPGFALEKSSLPGNGASVNPGDVIYYAVTGENTGDMTLEDVVISDDLTEVVEFATYGNDAVASTTHGSTGSLEYDEDTNVLEWNGSLVPGEKVLIEYAVIVKDGIAGELIKNVASGSATPPGWNPIKPPNKETTNPIPTPGYELEKSSTPASGTEVTPGQKIEYLVVGTNTGETILDPVIITDGFSGVIDYMTYNQDATATINGEEAGDLSVNTDETLATWFGQLNPGEAVEIRYSFTVNDNAAGKLLNNIVSSSALPPGHPPIEPPDQETEHPVPNPGFEIAKSADPESGTQVNPDDTITYTLTGTNTGETVLDPVVLTDDLSGVVSEYASFNDDVVALVDGEESGTLAFDESSHVLTWTGALEIGQSVTVSYSVTVLEAAIGHTLDNVLSGSAVPPGYPPIEPPDQETTHPVDPEPVLAKTGSQSDALLLVGLGAGALLLAAGLVMLARRNRLVRS